MKVMKSLKGIRILLINGANGWRRENICANVGKKLILTKERDML